METSLWLISIRVRPTLAETKGKSRRLRESLKKYFQNRYEKAFWGTKRDFTKELRERRETFMAYV
jgi:hypothetical protein